MNKGTQKVLWTIATVLIFGITGCGNKTDKSKTSDSAEFFKEIGTAEQESAEVINNMEMQNAALMSNAPSLTADLSLLPEKASIEDIQQALKNANLYSGKVDGVLGPKTKKAIEDFQAQNDLKADGKVGPKTWQKLKVYLNASVAPSEAADPGLETTSNDSSAAIGD